VEVDIQTNSTDHNCIDIHFQAKSMMVVAAAEDSKSMFDSKPEVVLDILRSMLAAGIGEVAVDLERIAAVA